MRQSNRTWTVGAIAIAVILLLTLITAPNTSKLPAGSTYSRAPYGYGAWYALMQQRHLPIQRWQQPVSDLLKLNSTPPTTLLQINGTPSQPRLDQEQQEWVKTGNTLVVLGVQSSVTAANFSTLQQSSKGNIKIDTRRRQRLTKEKQLLGDRFGAVVWQEQIGQGKAIFATTPHLAANAYQDYPSNYDYLSQLVSNGNPVLVDEYIHGYRNSEVKTDKTAQSWFAYLAQTPLLPALLQAGIVLLVLIWAQNRRWGTPLTPDPPIADNSDAYIQALAGILQTAAHHQFVVDVVGKAEQQQLQAALGLGQVPLEPQTLVNAWVQQTGRSPTDLAQLLRSPTTNRRLSNADLLTWIKKWQTLQQQARKL